MNFLKNNYEKVILFALFVIFAVLLFHLYFITQSTREVTDEDLEIKVRAADYKTVETKLKTGELPSEDFDFNKLFVMKSQWSKAVSRDGGGNKDFSDITQIFKISRCGHCQYLIPRRIMEEGQNCPLCKKNLLPPKAEEGGTKVAARLDSDEDGIPNVVELLFGLDPYDASDALHDLDGDGFSNVYEYLQLQDTEEFRKIFSEEKNFNADEIKNMALKNPKVHPELSTGLFIEKIERQKLNAELLGVSVLQNMQKENWNIQIEIKPHPPVSSKRRRSRLSKEGTAYLYIGATLRLTTGEYKVHDIRKDENAKVQKNVKKTSAGAKNDDFDKSYYVILKDKKDRDIVMKVGVDTYDLENEAFFGDVWGYKKYSGKVGNFIRMGNSTIGTVRYKIKAVNKIGEKVSVVLESPVKGGKDIVITNKAAMPAEFLPVKEDKENKNAENEENKKTAA